MTRFSKLLILLSCFIQPILAHSSPPPGTDLNGDLHKWFANQYSIEGAWCCDEADGHILGDDDWRMTKDGYEVWIEGRWRQVKSDAMRDVVRGGPNPTGHAIAWWAPYNADVIYCFAPGTQS